MQRSQIKIEILNKDYVDSLIVSLVRQGYSVYLGDDNCVYFDVVEDEIIKFKE